MSLSADLAASDDGFRRAPNLGWSNGDHDVTLHFVNRFRFELWDARAPQDDDIYAFRTRFGLKYSWKDRVTVFAQAQHTAILGLSSDASGAAALYRANSSKGNDETTESFNLKEGWIDIQPTHWLHVKGGRMNLNMGTWVPYSESNWQYVKNKRMSQRLMGTVGWTHGTRSFDAGHAGIDVAGHKINLFGGQPTRGVFDIEDMLEPLHDVVVGGVEWTAPKGVVFDDTEFRGFFLGYEDSRDIAGLFGEVEVYTLGGSVLGIYPLGPGNVDIMVWGAVQFGDFPNTVGPAVDELDHSGWAFLAEAGYQLTELYGKPWIRTGVNMASGDEDPTDGDHETFFNMLPTNHLYYGYADQLAFQNLIDWFVQFKWAPLPRLSLEVVFHRFWLHEDADLRYFGSGAFNKTSFGYGGSASGGANDVGNEIDVVAGYKLHQHISVLAGFSQMFGGDVFSGATDDDTTFAFAQLVVKY